MRKRFLVALIILACFITVFAVGCADGCNNCAGCGETECTHEWGAGEVTTEPKCNADGEKTFICSKCAETKTEAITERPAHSWNGGVETKPATETEKGIMTYTCIGCGETKTEDIPKLEPSNPSNPSQPNPPSHTHVYIQTWSKSATHHWHACSCGDKADYEPHNWNEGEITKNPEEGVDGEKTFTCIDCGQTKKEIVPALGHTHSYDTTVWKTNATHHYHACKCGDKIDDEPHDESDWIIDDNPTCSEYGQKHTECTICGVTMQTDIIEKEDHKWKDSYTTTDTQHWKECKNCSATTTKEPHVYSDGVCVCGQEEPLYTRNDKKILFGSYPQTKVTDNTLISTLNAQAGTLPTSENAQNWTSYGYYISGAKQDYMWYIDVTSGGEKYRGVYFTSYRPYYTNGGSSTGNSYQDDNGYNTNTVYWFKYEPISWTILDESKGLILCDMIIDSREFYINKESRTIGGQTVYSSNYEYSTIRAWLNDGFYQNAFTTPQKNKIKTTNVDNGERSTFPNNDTISVNNYICNDTQDKVFLLSTQEVTNTVYGFSEKESDDYDRTRLKQPTDYTMCQGVYTWRDYRTGTERKMGDWWLRSPNYRTNYHYYVRVVYGSRGDINIMYGSYTQDYDVDTNYGIAPALCIQL